MNYHFFFITFFFLVGTVSGQESLDKLLDHYNSHSIPYMSVEELAMFQKKDKIIILDARERKEFEVSHIPTAKFIGYDDFTSDEKELQNINKNDAILVYCSIGIRSEKIAEKLKKAGFTNIKNLYGGIFEWKNKGYSVVDSNGRKTENIHVFSKKWRKWLHTGNPVY